MDVSGRVTCCCVVLLLSLTSVSAAQKLLKSINDLKQIDFGQSVPKHSLLLLHWFANTVAIDNNNIIWLTFDPNSGDYGSHHYGNYEDMLEPLPRGNIFRYYTIGNIRPGSPLELPNHVVHPRQEFRAENRDRIIIRVREQNTGSQARQRIDQVFITQHYETSENRGTIYDPDHTYRITTNLLLQIREFSVGGNQQELQDLTDRFGSNADVWSIRNTWGELACLGLLLFIVIQEKHSSNQRNNRQENRRSQWEETRSRDRNVPPDFQNQRHVVVDFTDFEDHHARRTRQINRESQLYNGPVGQYVVSVDHNHASRTRQMNREYALYNSPVPQNNDQRSFGCICCICCSSFIASIVLIILCVGLYFWTKGSI